MLSMREPSTLTANTRHALTATPSNSTVQAPHSPCSQDRFAPVICSRSRSRSRSVRLGSTIASTSCEFSRNRISRFMTFTSWLSRLSRGRGCAVSTQFLQLSQHLFRRCRKIEDTDPDRIVDRIQNSGRRRNCRDFPARLLPRTARSSQALRRRRRGCSACPATWRSDSWTGPWARNPD